jgi:alkylhydroperoxidase/carboxymuconolactone decarboxylase family protein YurZ
MCEDRYQKGLEAGYRLWGQEFTDKALARLQAISPEFTRIVVEHVLGDIYTRPHLKPRERILCTLTALATQGRLEQLKVHIEGALRAGLSREVITEAFIHLSAYAGFPAAWSALRVAAEVFQEDASSG